MTGGLASPPESPHVAFQSMSSQRISSPKPIHMSSQVPVVSSPPTSSALPSEPSPTLLKQGDPDTTMDSSEDRLEATGDGSQPNNLTEEQVGDREDTAPASSCQQTSRRCSVSSLSDLSDMDIDDQPWAVGQSALESGDSDSQKEESGSENGEDDAMTGVELAAASSDAGKDGQENTIADEENASSDSALADQLAEVRLRRSSRNKQRPQLLTPLPLPTIVVQRKSGVRKERFFELVSFWNAATMLWKLTTKCFRRTGRMTCLSCRMSDSPRWVYLLSYIS